MVLALVVNFIAWVPLNQLNLGIHVSRQDGRPLEVVQSENVAKELLLLSSRIRLTDDSKSHRFARCVFDVELRKDIEATMEKIPSVNAIKLPMMIKFLTAGGRDDSSPSSMTIYYLYLTHSIKLGQETPMTKLPSIESGLIPGISFYDWVIGQPIKWPWRTIKGKKVLAVDRSVYTELPGVYSISGVTDILIHEGLLKFLN